MGRMHSPDLLRQRAPIPSPFRESARVIGELAETLTAEMAERRRLPDAIADKLRENRYFNLLAPKAIGGLEMDLVDYTRIVRFLAFHNGSTAWNMFINNSATLAAAYFPPAVAREYFGTDGKISICGVTAPLGKLQPQEDGGFIANGRWPWGSGVHHSDWMLGGCVLPSEDQRPLPVLALFRRDELEIIDTWNPLGLAGSGSHDYEVRDVRIDADRVLRLGALQSYAESPMYKLPLFPMIAPGVASVAIGLAERLLAELAGAGGSRRRPYSAVAIASAQRVQHELGRLQTLQRSATLNFEHALSKAVDAAATDTLTDLESIETIAACSFAVDTAVEVTSFVYRTLGGSSVAAGSVVHDGFRDCHTLSQHAQVSPYNFEVLGQWLLTGDTDWKFYRI